jgi:hypothetical protein
MRLPLAISHASGSYEWSSKVRYRGQPESDMLTLNVLNLTKADNPGVLRALKTGSREAWHIGVRCDVTIYLDRIVPTCDSHRGRSCERNVSPFRLY